MPKIHSDYSENLNLRITIAQRDFLDEVASLHKTTPSDYLRALLDAALMAEARPMLGMPGASEEELLAKAYEIVSEHEGVSTDA